MSSFESKRHTFFYADYLFQEVGVKINDNMFEQIWFFFTFPDKRREHTYRLHKYRSMRHGF